MMLDRINALLLSVLLAIAPLASARASQNSLLSPTTGTVSGLQLTNNINNALDSLNTCNSGATAPTNQLSGSASLGNCWLNTTSAPYPYGVNDGSSNWPSMGALDPTAHAWNMQIGGGTATLSSASTVDLCSTPRNYLTISGTTTITSFGSSCPGGVVKLVTFSGILQITYNATSLIIPGAVSIPATSAGDQATLVSLGSGNWQIATYTPASGAALINPSIDVCSYVLSRSVSVPSSKYLLAYGQTISRATYPAYLACSTITQSLGRTNGSPTLTGFSDTTQIATGACIEGSGIPNSGSCTTTIVSCTSTTCTMSQNASSSGTANVTIFPDGNGDGSTTLNLPNCAGVALVGRPNMGGTPRGNITSTYASTNPNALSASFGAQSQTLSLLQTPGGITAGGSATVSPPGGKSLPAYLAPATTSVTAGGVANGVYDMAGISNISLLTSLSGTASVTSTNTGAAGNGTGAAAPHPILPPMLTVNCMIRVLAMIDAPSSPRSFGANDNFILIADRRRA